VLTFCAPAERAEREALLAAREAYLANSLAVTLMNAIPDYAVVINAQRQIVAANALFLEALGLASIDELMGLRPGEAVGCVYAAGAPGGCGTGKYCLDCGGVDAMVECLRTRQPVTRECRVVTAGEAGGGALTLSVHATFLTAGDQDLVVLVLRDIGDEKRRRVLERVFFHEVLNTVSSLHVAAELMTEADDDPMRMKLLEKSCLRLSRRALEEITRQQQLLAAEQDNLQVRLSEITVAEMLRQVCEGHLHPERGKQCALRLGAYPSASLVTDIELLRHALGNLLQNALEATGPAGTVTLAVQENETTLAFSIHNPGVMPEAVQRQIFQRAFSTKGEEGRGIGAYSAKLLTERYLGGQISFCSREPDGTLFTIELPRRLPPHSRIL